MRVLILGGTGMLGHKVVQVLNKRFETFCTIRGRYSEVERFRIFDPSRVIENVDALEVTSILSAIETTTPDVIVNCIGIIKQLPSSEDVVQTLSINSIVPQLIAKYAAKSGCRFITVSTDCVFSGNRGRYSEADVPDATDLYGRSKQYGEVTGSNCLSLRTSIIGREIASAHSLIEWILRQEGSVRGYADAIFSGLPTLILSELIAEIIEIHPDLEGLFHVSGDPISKYDLIDLVRKNRSLELELEEDHDVQIDRSLDSSKFRLATGFLPLTWREMVDRMFSDPTPYDEWRNQS